MSIIEKVFKYEATEITTINVKGNIWFKGKDVAKALGYENSRKAILKHVDDDDKSIFEKIRGGSQNGTPFKNEQKHTIFINESGLYSLIFGSKLESAKVFKRWVTSEVLPSIRKTGSYHHKPFKMLTFNIQTEYDLHMKVVNYIRNHHPKALLVASLGENQINSNMRLRSYNLGYQKGTPDLLILNHHKEFSGMAVEFKSPRGNNDLSEAQNMMLREYKNNSYKVLVSNNYDEIITAVIRYFDDVRFKCMKCSRLFKSAETLTNHKRYIHNI